MPIPDWKEAALKLLKTDTTPSNGDSAIIPLLKELLEGAGLNMSTQSVTRGGIEHINLLARRGEGPGGLLLMTHIDTGEASNPEMWTETNQNAFNPVIKDDRIYGLGASDAKLDWLAKTMALHSLKQEKLNLPLLFATTYGEQLGFLGARHLMASGEVRNSFAIVAVPSSLNVIYAHKGYIGLKVRLKNSKSRKNDVSGVMPVTRIVCRGKDAHSSTAHLGENAILKGLHILDGYASKGKPLHVVAIEGGVAMNRVPDLCMIDVAGDESALEDIQDISSDDDIFATAITMVTEGADMSFLLRQIKKIWKEWNDASELLQPLEDDAFDPPKAMCNLSTAHGTAEKLEFVLEARLLPEHDPEDMVTALDGILRDLEYHHPNLKTEFEINHLSRGLAGSADSEITKLSIETLKKVGVDAKAATIAGSTEAQIISSYNINTIIFGPGSVEQVGSPNEFALLDEVEKASEFYKEIIRRICS